MVAKKLPLFLGFDSFFNDGQPQALSQSYDGARNDLVARIGEYVSDERPINFQLV